MLYLDLLEVKQADRAWERRAARYSARHPRCRRALHASGSMAHSSCRSLAPRGLVVASSVPRIVVVVAAAGVGESRAAGVCVCDGASRPLGLSGDVAVAAEILIDDSFAQRPSVVFAGGVNGSQDHAGHMRFLSLIGWGRRALGRPPGMGAGRWAARGVGESRAAHNARGAKQFGRVASSVQAHARCVLAAAQVSRAAKPATTRAGSHGPSLHRRLDWQSVSARSIKLEITSRHVNGAVCQLTQGLLLDRFTRSSDMKTHAAIAGNMGSLCPANQHLLKSAVACTHTITTRRQRLTLT